MVWITFLAVSLALSFIVLGMLAAMVFYLKLALLGALLVIAGFIVVNLWRKFVAPRLNRQKAWQSQRLISKEE